MAVTNEQVAAVRALLAGQFDDYQSQLAELDHAAAPKGFNALIAAGFLEAVERRFVGKGLTRGAVVEFVADVRSRSADIGEDLDPRVAERLILAALGKGSIEDIEGKTVVYTQMILLTMLVHDENLDDDALDEFMGAVRATAEEWSS
jgi:hypothetical protein